MSIESLCSDLLKLCDQGWSDESVTSLCLMIDTESDEVKHCILSAIGILG